MHLRKMYRCSEHIILSGELSLHHSVTQLPCFPYVFLLHSSFSQARSFLSLKDNTFHLFVCISAEALRDEMQRVT